MPGISFFKAMDASASAMTAEKKRMTAAAENMAHAGSTAKTENGLPYARQRVVFQSILDANGKKTGEVSAEIVDSARYKKLYDPTHPDADPTTGMVTESDIDPILELTDMMVASKAYEANSNAVRGVLKMHEQALRLAER